MSRKNRTANFQRLITNYQKNSQGNTTGSPTPKTPNGNLETSEFAIKTKTIQIRIAELSHKISNFVKMTKDSSLFKENSEQMARRAHLIRAELEKISSSIKDTAALSKGSDFPNGQAIAYGEGVLLQMQDNLSQMAKDFQDALSLRSDTLRAFSRRKKMYTSGTSLPARNFSQISRENKTALEEESSTKPEQPFAPQKALSLQQNAMQLQETKSPQQTEYLQNRLEASQNVEQTISELSTMYRRLSALVAVQEENCLRIDVNIDSSAVHVKEGKFQLKKYYLSSSGNRLLVLKVFTVLIFLAAVLFFFSS